MFSIPSLEVGVEAIEDIVYSDDEDSTVYKPELAIISAPTILLTLEAGIGNKTLPMLLLHIGFESNISDWSTKTVSYSGMTLMKIFSHYSFKIQILLDEHGVYNVGSYGIL